jgi:hypothetical protein
VTPLADIRWDDDDELLALLDEALRTEGEVPPDFIAAGKAAFTWRSIDAELLDAELAALVYDSEREPALTRTQTADLRALTFASAHVTIELELTDSGLLGQVIPPAPAQVDVQTAAGVTVSVPADELGCFTIRDIPQEPFRLRCRVGDTVDVLTTWITR